MRNAFDPARIARMLVHTGRDAALGTLDADGAPHSSHVATATLADGAPILLLSDLAVHTQNVRKDSRGSLLFVADEGEGPDTATRARVTIGGRVSPVTHQAEARSRFVRRHPDAELYIDFADMHLMRLDIERAYLVAGFGRIVTLSAGELASPDTEGLADLDESACRHMDEDHSDALSLIATRLGGGQPGNWRAVGVDALGIDLACGARGIRAEYDRPIASAGELRSALKRLTDAARED